MRHGREYLRAAEIASLTGMSLRTIRRWIREKTLPSTKIGGARLVAVTDLEATLTGPEGKDAVEEYDPKSEL
jgi:excisionase family DNA binding protein